jgi:tetratricopeptide (TPR) repeat protein
MFHIGAGQAVRAGDEPTGVEGYLNRAAERYARGEFDPAIKDLDEAIRLDPKCALAYSGRGAVRFAKKEYDKAIRYVDEAVRLEPDSPSSGYYIRGAAHYMKKDYARAVKDLDEAIKLNPKEAEALNSRAWAAAACPEAKFRDADNALRFAKAACEIDGWKNAFFLGTLAAAHAENGQFKEAVRWQRKALEDPAYKRECGEEGRKMLKLFEQGKPYREAAEGKK